MMQRLLPFPLFLALGVLAGLPGAPAAAQNPPTAGDNRQAPDSLPETSPHPAGETDRQIAERDLRLAEIDGQLQRGEWERAATALRVWLDRLLASDGGIRAAGPAPVLARLAVAEAGLGREEDARWHWFMAVALPGAMPMAEQLRGFGAAGAFVSRQPLRELGEAPEGMAVRRDGDGGPALVPPHKTAGEVLDRPVASGEPSYPEWLELEVVVDAAGKPVQPVLGRSTSWRLAYRVLEGLRSWRFEPATAGGTPVAVFHEVKIHQPADSPPLDQLVRDSPQITEILDLLHAGQWAKAGQRGDQLWQAALDGALQSRQLYALLLALRALAEAGQGETDEAICRWQAAQALAPLLYDVDLSAFGDPGNLMESHRWGLWPSPGAPVKVVAINSGEQVERPEIRKRVQPRYPQFRKAERAKGRVVLETVIDQQGALRHPRVLASGPGPDFDAASLEAVCAWRFKPAAKAGRPIKVWYDLTINFEVRD